MDSCFRHIYQRRFQKGHEEDGEENKRKGPRLKLIVPGLSIKFDDMKGPIVDGELPKCKFGKKIAAQLKSG
ncbi:MAG: hypothetical protein ACUVQY_02695 [Thermoproteota archaeon]